MNSSTDQFSDRIPIETSFGTIFPHRSEIIRFQGGHNCVYLFLTTSEKPVKILHKLRDIEALCSDLFRCHISHVINLDHVTKYERKACRITTTNGIVPIAETRLKDFESRIKRSVRPGDLKTKNDDIDFMRL
ncbi:MAG TPA: LytTR family DNA-binding domain-containing protein [Bacteroidales bacterium]|nr:LytTR family DNA-binding domain-containing protein [Bacteroidales bacterium]